ncbi:acyloxyacyl hydrolase [Paracoccaceae bacterium]|nr:acyloxyacyl hydrolase [Paracoccaceae bacterium]
MWGGIYAVLFSISTILSYENPIKNGFPVSAAESYTKYTWSDVEFQNQIVGKEIQYSFYEKKKFGPLQRGQSISITDQGGIWTGYGFIRKVKLTEALNFNFDFFPGLYFNNGEEDLGGWVMFRSGIELEYRMYSDWKISIGYDHRSSGDLWKYNPGMETIKISIIKTHI